MALDYKIIGQRIQKVRKTRKITQQVLSEKIGVSTATISRIERGNLKINLARLNQICEILGISEGYILNGSSKASSYYLMPEFSSLLKDCSPKNQKIIYELAKTVKKLNSEET